MRGLGELMNGSKTRECRPILVVQLPERLNLAGSQEFLREAGSFLKADRPWLVFDFSEVRQMDSAGVDMLQHCLETVIKRDGDLKLAGVSPECAVILELMRADRLFEIFETSSDAVESFHGFSVQALKHVPGSWVPEPAPMPRGVAGTMDIAS